MSLKEQFGKDILLTGWGHSRFGKLTDETLESLIVQVATEAISNAGIEPAQIDEIYLGQFNSGMMPWPSRPRSPCRSPSSSPTSPPPGSRTPARQGPRPSSRAPRHCWPEPLKPSW
jgi:hypothetical protein